MEIISTSLALEKYSNEILGNQCWVGDNGDSTLLAILDLKKRPYGYFFLKVDTALEGNKFYHVERVVLDSDLDDITISTIVFHVIRHLTYRSIENGNRADRIETNIGRTYLINKESFSETYQHVVFELLNLIHSKEIKEFTPDILERLKEAKKLMDNMDNL